MSDNAPKPTATAVHNPCPPVNEPVLPLFPPHAPADPVDQALEWAHSATPGHLDELREADGRMRPHWASFFQNVGMDGMGELNRRAQSLARQIRDNGVTYNVYADDHGTQRPWSLDLFPMVVSPDCWATIEAGVLQRTRLLNAMLADLYGPQQLLKKALLPPALVQGHPGYLRPMQGVQPLGGTWLNVAAFDLARGPDGQWRVVSQRTQAPSGLGYLLENRIAIARQFPKAFAGMKVQRLAASYQALVSGIRAMAPNGPNARIALLTPGPYNETYFEHAFLARYLGLSLVEGSDLTVRDQRLYLKTLTGLEPVDALIKRLDDEWLDPLELRSDSALGVPGLLQVVRAGKLLLANAPGSALLESNALLGFLPAISRELLGQELILQALPTWWCGEPAALQRVLPQLRHGVIKPTYPNSPLQTLMGQSLSADTLDQMTGRMVQQPEDYTVQSYLPLSETPTWSGDQITPRAAMLRVYALADGPQSWRVLPGGLVRLAPRGQLMASMQHGGSSADCWVMTEGEVDRTSLLQSAPTTLALAQSRRPVTSRAAENLFWLGRYTERAESTVRLAQVILRNLHDEEPSTRPLQAWMTQQAQAQALVSAHVPGMSGPGAQRVFERSLIAALADADGAYSVGFNLRALRLAAANVRERLSQEQRHLIEQAELNFLDQCGVLGADTESAAQEALNALEEASEALAGITGAQTDRMVRDNGWRLLSIGRHIERLATLAQAMRQAFETGSVLDAAGFEALVSLFDSTITFHSHYQQRRDVVALLDLLLINRDNPRSLAWVLDTLRSRLRKLEQGDPEFAQRLFADLPDPSQWDLAHLSTPDAEGQHADLLDVLAACETSAFQLSDALSQQHFSHAERDNRSLLA
ncbi:circularly permuted type 2 ATP-grasp protein [Hydrogenophaga soli]